MVAPNRLVKRCLVGDLSEARDPATGLGGIDRRARACVRIGVPPGRKDISSSSAALQVVTLRWWKPVQTAGSEAVAAG